MANWNACVVYSLCVRGNRAKRLKHHVKHNNSIRPDFRFYVDTIRMQCSQQKIKMYEYDLLNIQNRFIVTISKTRVNNYCNGISRIL